MSLPTCSARQLALRRPKLGHTPLYCWWLRVLAAVPPSLLLLRAALRLPPCGVWLPSWAGAAAAASLLSASWQRSMTRWRLRMPSAAGEMEACIHSRPHVHTAVLECSLSCNQVLGGNNRASCRTSPPLAGRCCSCRQALEALCLAPPPPPLLTSAQPAPAPVAQPPWTSATLLTLPVAAFRSTSRVAGAAGAHCPATRGRSAR